MHLAIYLGYYTNLDLLFRLFDRSSMVAWIEAWEGWCHLLRLHESCLRSREWFIPPLYPRIHEDGRGAYMRYAYSSLDNREAHIYLGWIIRRVPEKQILSNRIYIDSILAILYRRFSIRLITGRQDSCQGCLNTDVTSECIHLPKRIHVLD